MPKTVRAVIPPKFRSDAVMKVLQQELDKFAPFLLKDFEKTVASWQGEKPKFIKALIIRPDSIAIQIRATGSKKGQNKWLWLDEGTRPHRIRPKRAKTLRFPGGKYHAGSSPNSTYTSRATPASGPDVFAKSVKHPGTKARKWSEIIIRENQQGFERWMQAAMERAARASGHAAK